MLAVLPAAWWLAGGWSLDLHAGRPTRAHGDIDASILRPDHVRVRAALADWDAYAADPPGTGTLRPWAVGASLEPHVHHVWFRRAPGEPWRFQLMLEDVDGEDWVYRRDPRIRRGVGELRGPASTATRRVLAPEIQLLYKSKTIGPEDQTDFEIVLPVLTGPQREWLREALAMVSPGHPWLEQLGSDR